MHDIWDTLEYYHHKISKHYRSLFCDNNIDKDLIEEKLLLVYSLGTSCCKSATPTKTVFFVWNSSFFGLIKLLYHFIIIYYCSFFAVFYFHILSNSSTALNSLLKFLKLFCSRARKNTGKIEHRVSLKFFFKLSYKISLLKNGFVTLFVILLSYSFQKITLNSSCIGKCIICALILEFLYPKRVKKTKNPVADDKNCKIFSRHVQKPTTVNSNQDTIFTTKPNPLSLTQSENYSFGASFDKISSNNNKIYLFKFSNF